MSTVHYSLCSSLVWFQPQECLSLGRALIFQIHLGIHPGNMGDKLVYYYLYHKEEKFHLDICPQPFNRNFLILYTNTIFIHLI